MFVSRLVLLEKQLQTYTQLGFVSLEEARRRSQADNQVKAGNEISGGFSQYAEKEAPAIFKCLFSKVC